MNDRAETRLICLGFFAAVVVYGLRLGGYL